MPYTAWPTAAQLATELNRFNIGFPVAAADLGSYVDQAVSYAYGTIGYPFIEQASASVLFPAPGEATLFFNRWYSAITAVAVGVSETDTTGTVLDIGTDCFFKKARTGQIYAVCFASPVFGSIESVKVTGTQGWDENIPADLWQAVLDYAAALAQQKLRATLGVMTEVKQADRQMKYAESVEPEKWLAEREAALRRVMQSYIPFPFAY